MNTVKEVIKIKEIEKILNMFEKCLNYYQYYENIYNFMNYARTLVTCG